MKKINKFIIVASTLGILSDCGASSDINKDKTKVEFASANYPWIFSSVRKDLVEGNLSKSIKENNSIGNVTQLKNLNYLESGRLLQLNSDYKSSIKSYDNALKSVPQNEKESLKQAKKILLDRNTYNYYDIKTAYSIPDYAITFLYTYQALNYLKTNNVEKAIGSLDHLDKAQIWGNQQGIISEGMKHLAKKSFEQNDITYENLGIDNFKQLNEMFNFSKRIPDAEGNPMSFYLRAILESAVLKDYKKALQDIQKAQKYTVGNKYINQSQNEISSAVDSQTSPFSMGMGRVIVFYEQGLVNVRRSAEASFDLGDIGIRKLKLPIYKTNYDFFDPKKVTISSGNNTVVDTYTETLLDGTLFAMKSLIEEYSRIITQNVVIESFKSDYDKNFSLGGILGSRLKFDLSSTDPKRADLRSWLLVPNSVDLFEQQIDSGNYKIQVNNIIQNIEVKQGKTTLLWIVDIGSFKKVYYFIV